MLVLLFLFVAGCGSPAAATPPPADANVSVPPTQISVPTEAPVVPTQAQSSAGLIKINFENVIRLIPAALNPEAQSGDIVSQYQAVISNSSNEWAGGAIARENVVSLRIAALSQDKTITLKYPIHASVIQKDVSVENLNMLVPMGGGGGGEEVKEFSSAPLQTGEFDLMPMDLNPAALSFSNVPSMPYLVKMTCQQAGAFDLTFTIPYNVSDMPGDFAETYTVSFICPQSVTVWGYGGPQLQKLNQLIFQNGEYVGQP